MAMNSTINDPDPRTQREAALEGTVTPEMETVALSESIGPEDLRKAVAQGRVAIPLNIKRRGTIPAIGIGRGLHIKINSNIGTSPKHMDLEEELEKLEISERYGADTVMDLSTGGDLDSTRKKIIQASNVPIGTVPIYQAMVEHEDIRDIPAEAMLEVIERQARQGVDFVTVHCGLTRGAIPHIKDRVAGVVSRGGTALVKWMIHNKAENPLYEGFDDLCRIAKEHDVTLSLGDGLRPGCLHDATDRAQLHELKVLGELTQRAWDHGVQVIIEGPGHVPYDQIRKNMEMQQEICHGAPFYVLGPLTTDLSPGYDHISAAIGGTLAAIHGASFLCYVTPAEHLRLPKVQDVKEGVIASKIAAHSADIALGLPGAIERDTELARARRKLDWDRTVELCLDPDKASALRDDSEAEGDECTMCGKFCVMKVLDDDGE